MKRKVNIVNVIEKDENIKYVEIKRMKEKIMDDIEDNKIKI
jgi:septin family protein